MGEVSIEGCSESKREIAVTFQTAGKSEPFSTVRSDSVKLLLPSSTNRTTSRTPNPQEIASMSGTGKTAIKRGFRSFNDPQACGVSIKILPAWLWSNTPSHRVVPCVHLTTKC